MKKKIDNYTMIEILVVMMIIGILMGIGVGALNNMKGASGISGTVRNLGAQLSLGRSQAVGHNRFVAVLLPDAQVTADGITNNTTSGFVSAADRAKLFTQSRLCYVVVDGNVFKFDRWVDDSSWVKWSNGIMVYASENFSQVIKIDNIPGKNSTAVVFAHTGALTHSNIVKIQVFRAIYDSKKAKLIYSTKERKDSGWEVRVNPFTGGTSYAKKHKN